MFDNIASLLPHHARRKPCHPALIQGEHTITYRQLDLDVRRTAAHILDLDITPGDIVAMAMLDGADYAVVMMALARAGAVMLPLDVRWTVDEKQRVAAFFGAGTVLVSEGAENIPNLRTLPVDDAWHAHVARADAERDFPGDPDAPMLLSLSSGTTGTPKGPMLSHQQMLLRARTQWVTLTMNEHDRFLCATPMYFGGARGYTLCHLVIGGTVVMMPPPWGPEQIVRPSTRSTSPLCSWCPPCSGACSNSPPAMATCLLRSACWLAAALICFRRNARPSCVASRPTSSMPTARPKAGSCRY